jgi:hypothetical protein
MGQITRCVLFLSCVVPAACAIARVPDVNTPQANRPNYPVVIEQSQSRQQRAESAWVLFLTENRLPRTAPDLDPILAVPRSIPPELAQRININQKGGTLSPEAAKEALRQFVERSLSVLAGNQQDRELTLKDLSLVSFSNDATFYRATYHQTSFLYPLTNGYGDLIITISKAGDLLQLTSRLVPIMDLPSSPGVDITKLTAAFVGREFKYAGIDGRELRYRVATPQEIVVRDLVIYPKEENGRLSFYLAYPVEMGRGTTWTVFIDAVTGQEIGVKQNFNT